MADSLAEKVPPAKDKTELMTCNPDSANNFINSNFLKSENLHVVIPNSLVTSRGEARGVPEDMSVEEIIQSAKSPQNVVHARRINRRVVNEDNTMQDIAGTPKIFIKQIYSKLDNYTEAVFMELEEDTQKGGNDDRSSAQGPSSPTEY
nr:unnamed protein product [Callosobruchus analis]